MSVRTISRSTSAPPADRLLDVREAAAMLAVKPATWAYQRRIPVVKLMGRAQRFRLSDLHRLISEGERPPSRGFGDKEEKYRFGIWKPEDSEPSRKERSAVSR